MLRYRRALGVAVGLGAVLVAVARVAAHVHHAQDVVAGLAIGVGGGAVGIWLVAAVTAIRCRRRERSEA